MDGDVDMDTVISIHAPLAGSDISKFRYFRHPSNFNPRSPRRERPHSIALLHRSAPFQSTLPSQGATKFPPCPDAGKMHFNPRSPRRERLCILNGSMYKSRFQSTLPSQGATGIWYSKTNCTQFQSTLPSQGATIDVLTTKLDK